LGREVADAPGGYLWIAEVEVSKQGGVIEVPETTGVVSHGVKGARE
jgi:hypothetical protein